VYFWCFNIDSFVLEFLLVCCCDGGWLWVIFVSMAGVVVREF